MTRILCLSIRQPWAWAILNAGKDIENRNWSTKFRGRILIHASKGCTRDEYECAEESILHASTVQVWESIPELKDLERGGIVGSVEIVDCADRSDSPWFVGKYGFVLANPRPIPFIPCKGQLGFFECPPDVLQELVSRNESRLP